MPFFNTELSQMRTNESPCTRNQNFFCQDLNGLPKLCGPDKEFIGLLSLPPSPIVKTTKYMDTVIRFLPWPIVEFFCLNNKFLLFNFISRNLIVRYRKSFLGYLWTVIQPMTQVLTYLILFKLVYPSNIPDFPALIGLGILTWTFFSHTLTEGMDTLMGNSTIVLQIKVPLNIFAVTVCVSNFINYLFSIPILIALFVYLGIPFHSASVIYVPFLLFCLFIQALSFSFVLSILIIYLRDLKHAMGFFMQLWMYTTPILFREAFMPPSIHWLVYANPVGKIFSGLSRVLIFGEHLNGFNDLGVPFLWTTVIFSGALLVHSRATRYAIERI